MLTMLNAIKIAKIPNISVYLFFNPTRKVPISYLPIIFNPARESKLSMKRDFMNAIIDKVLKPSRRDRPNVNIISEKLKKVLTTFNNDLTNIKLDEVNEQYQLWKASFEAFEKHPYKALLLPNKFSILPPLQIRRFENLPSTYHRFCKFEYANYFTNRLY